MEQKEMVCDVCGFTGGVCPVHDIFYCGHCERFRFAYDFSHQINHPTNRTKKPVLVCEDCNEEAFDEEIENHLKNLESQQKP